MYTWKRWTKPGRVRAGSAVDQTTTPPTQGNPLFTGKSGKEFIFKENRPNNDGDMREMNMDYLLARVQNVHIADEARNEAETLINDWLNEKIITELTGDENQDENLPVVSANLPPNAAPIKPTSWYNDSDTFLQEYLVKQGCGPAPDNNENDIDVYAVDQETAVSSVLNRFMQKPLDSSKLSKDLGLDKKKKLKRVKDPVVTMEMRHQQVKEARQRRQEEILKRREKVYKQKEAERLAEQMLKQEEKRKLQQARTEEEAIQKEMLRIRREMLERKRREAKELEMRLNVVDIQPPGPAIQDDKVPEVKSKIEVVSAKQDSESTSNNIKQSHELDSKIYKMQQLRSRRILKQCFSAWFILVLKREADLGKAKAMSDWNNLLRTWTAWRRYTLEQVVQRDTNQHQVYLQQLRLKETRAQKGHRSKLLYKTFAAWKKYVKMEQYNQEILKQQERTKAKMQALLDNVAAAAKEQAVVLTSLDGDEVLISEVSTSKVDQPVRMKTPSKDPQVTKSRKPIHAWQVNRNHVKDLTVDEIKNIGDANHVKTKLPATHNHRFKFQKKVIDEQGSLINKQKQLIEELTSQQREVNVALEQKVQERLTNADRSNGSSSSRSQLSQNRPRNLALLKRPKSVVAMEERAAERARRRQELEEKRKEEERAKVEKLKKDEEERIQKEEEEKRERIQMLKNLKKIKEQKEKEKQDWANRMRELHRIAEDHYKRTLMKRFGINPWKKLMQIQWKKMEVAEYHHCRQATSVVFHAWKDVVEKIKLERNEIADQFYSKLLVRRSISSWKKYGESMAILERKADIHYNGVLKVKYLRWWEQYVTDERLSYLSKQEEAAKHSENRILRSAFNSLKHHRQNVKREEQRRHRVSDMRRKVAQLLPDFCPDSSITA